MLNQSAANKGPQALFPQLQSLALGMVPGLGKQAGSTLTGLMQGQLPDVSSSVNPAFQSLLNANKQQVAQGAAGIRESFGSSGLSNSSSAGLGLSNFYTQSQNNFMNILSQYTLQAQQQAANLQLGASQVGLSAFLNPAFTDVGPKGSVVGAGLGSLGGGLTTLAMLKGMGVFGGGGTTNG
jgi:hypothetical protein